MIIEQLNRPNMDAGDAEYAFGGQLLGTQWKSDRMETDEIEKVARSFTRVEGHMVHYPEVVFKYTGRRIRVEQFRAMVLEGRMEPVDHLAEHVAEVLG